MAHGKTLTLRKIRPKLFSPIYRDGFVIYPDGSVYQVFNGSHRKVPERIAEAVRRNLGTRG